MELYDFYTGTEFHAHTWLGAHSTQNGVVFRTFAPNAAQVDLLLEDDEIEMYRIADGNFFEVQVPYAHIGQKYEYRIFFHNGGYQDHADPYGFRMERRPDHKSIVCDLQHYSFHDQTWMRKRTDHADRPLNIYELHLGSWRRHPDGSFLTYTQIAEQLIPYVKESGYNAIEIMPISEHPCDESWGYQNTGFFAPTSRYGTPHDLMAMVDLLHQNDIGVILDFVPVHFAVDAYGLARYDGTALYEYPDRAVGLSEWGSCNFMHSRGEVGSFLQSAANYWLETYHFDGLRIDAISRIIYWQGDEKRGVNGNAIEFIKVMNAGLKERHKGIMLIAEDSTHYEGITKPVCEGGLGFDYKWDMGWMHDTLEYFQMSPAMRSENYHKLTFSMIYYYNERYLLPYSHDEVVHGKATILQKMHGPYEDKFPQCRAMYLYMMVHPGKKLNFMGNEFGQFREWDEKREQDWDLRTYPTHDGFYRFIRDLNHIYLYHPALSKRDHQEDGFLWVDCHQEKKCIYVISRKCKSEELIAMLNFGDLEQVYALPAGYADLSYEILIHTDWQIYGGDCPLIKGIEDTGRIVLPRSSGILLKIK